jgi:hypothetical protein
MWEPIHKIQAATSSQIEHLLQPGPQFRTDILGARKLDPIHPVCNTLDPLLNSGMEIVFDSSVFFAKETAEGGISAEDRK